MSPPTMLLGIAAFINSLLLPSERPTFIILESLGNGLQI